MERLLSIREPASPEEKILYDAFCVLRRNDQAPSQGRLLLTASAFTFVSLHMKELRLNVHEIQAVKQIDVQSPVPTIVVVMKDHTVFVFTNFAQVRVVVSLANDIINGKAPTAPSSRRDLLRMISEPVPSISKDKHDFLKRNISDEATSPSSVLLPEAVLNRAPIPESPPQSTVAVVEDAAVSTTLAVDISPVKEPETTTVTATGTASTTATATPVPAKTTPSWRSYNDFANDAVLSGPTLGGECPYFLSGYCREGDNCHLSHGDPALRVADILRSTSITDDNLGANYGHDREGEEEGEDEEEATGYGGELYDDRSDVEDNSDYNGSRRTNTSRWKRELIFNVNALLSTELELGDKIILNSSILAETMRMEGRFSWPLTFEITNPQSNSVIHVGVLEFSSAQRDVALFPQWILEHLQASVSPESPSKLRCRAVNLPKGTFCQLQPVTSEWIHLSIDVRQPLLEFQLRNFQSLTKGSIISFPYEYHTYSFKVLDCKPSDAICIVDADIETDIVEPQTMQSEGIIELGQTLKGSSKVGEAAVFQLRPKLQQPFADAITIIVTAISGDPDLYVHPTFQIPSRANYFACAQESGSVSLCVGKHTPLWNFPKEFNALYFAVEPTAGECSFTITARLSTVEEVQGAMRETNISSSIEDVEIPSGSYRCQNCRTILGLEKQLMHERHCAKRMHHCQLCKVNVPLSQRDKHDIIEHSRLDCVCGERFTQTRLHRHQREECSFRLVSCSNPWCSLLIQARQLDRHVVDCLMKTAPCCLCAQEIRYRDLEGHLSINHSVDTSVIDWSTPLKPDTFSYLERPISPPVVETASKYRPTQTHLPFACLCGQGFQNQDDMQIHILTTCPQRETVMRSFGFDETIEPVEELKWNCEACTFENTGNGKVCCICSTRRP